jgi:hypothetical protein
MLAPTGLTWILLVSGWVLALLLLVAQGLMAFRPHSRRAREIVIGKGEDWRDRTHFKSAYGMAVADLGFQLPLLVAGSVGVVMGESWGYLLWAASGSIAVYISIVLWFLEREYVYAKAGPLAYYTFYWGFFVYWGLAVTAYSVLRVAGVRF